MTLKTVCDKREISDLVDQYPESKMNKNQILKQLDSFEKQLDRTVSEFKTLLKTIRTEIKNQK